MCGILGVIEPPDRTSKARVESRLNLLRHRGPDGLGLWRSADRTAWLGHTRLSVIDPDVRSTQPMSSLEADVTVTFNGELYNYRELRAHLATRGHSFRTDSDTEVLLAAYLEWGSDCLRHIHGMFAFGLLDERPDRGSLFLARDRVGQKPLYYSQSSEWFEFASESSALTADEVNPVALNHYLALGYLPWGTTLAKGILKLEPGTAMTVDTRSLETRHWRYWSPALPDPDPIDHKRLIEEVSEKCRTAVRRCLVSDVPLVTFLSGGLDSGLVTALSAQTYGEGLRAITVAFPRTKFDETALAELTAKHCGVDHVVLTAAVNPEETLPEILRRIDEPIGDSSIVPTYVVSKAARTIAKVALGGDGGDEVFGGYGHHQAAARPQRSLASLYRRFATLAERLPPGVPGRRRLLSIRGGIGEEAIWGSSYFDPHLRGLIAPGVSLNDDEHFAPERGLLSAARDRLDPVDRSIARDLLNLLPGQYLLKTDRAGMWNGLEIRSPLLDHELIDFVYRYAPSALRATRETSRSMEREVAAPLLPSAVASRTTKQGFSFPVEEWLRTDPAADILTDYFGDLPGAIDRRQAHSLLFWQRKGFNNGSRLFALVTLAAACRNRGLS